MKNEDFKLGDLVVHPEIYHGNETYKVVGIRKDQIEIEGDFSGGTHKVLQSGWFKKDGMFRERIWTVNDKKEI